MEEEVIQDNDGFLTHSESFLSNDILIDENFFENENYSLSESNSDTSLSSSMSSTSSTKSTSMPSAILEEYNRFHEKKIEDISNFVFYLGLLAVASIIWRFMWLFYFIKLILQILQSNEVDKKKQTIKLLEDYSSPLIHYFINKYMFKDSLNEILPIKYFSNSITYTQFALNNYSNSQSNTYLDKQLIKDIYSNYTEKVGPSPTTLILQVNGPLI